MKTSCRLRDQPEQVIRAETGTRNLRRYFGVPWFLIGRWTRYLFVLDEGTAYVVLGETVTESDLDRALEPEDHSGPTGRSTLVLVHSWAHLAPDVRTDLAERRVALRFVEDGCPPPRAAG